MIIIIFQKFQIHVFLVGDIKVSDVLNNKC